MSDPYGFDEMARHMTVSMDDQGPESPPMEAYADDRDLVPERPSNVYSIKGGRRMSDEGPAFDHAGGWKIQTSAEFVADFVPPEYIVDGTMQRGRFYTLTAPTGHGKTAVMLYGAAAIAMGDSFAGRETEQGDVLILAGENPDDVRARWIATLEYYQIDPRACRVRFVAGTFSIRQDLDLLRAKAAECENLVLVVIDTFAAYFDGDDENSNAQALDFARVARKVTAFPSRPAVVMPTHPVKNATRQNLTPKGGSSLLNECDGNLTLWNEEGVLTLHWQGKFRSAEFEPLKFEFEKYTSDRLKDKHGRLIPTILAKPIMETRAHQIAVQTLSDEDKLLLNIKTYPAQSIADRAIEIGLKMRDGSPYKSRVQKLLGRLRQQKLIRQFRTNWEITKEGERAVEMIENGESFAPDGGL
jgi:hypothetical protein